MNGDPKVAATMLVHNPNAITLNRAMKAVQAQTLVPSSLVIVDNGSDPAVELDASTRWALLRLDKNLGVGAGHNFGWRHALETGDADYLWVLEHDSIPDLDCLERLVEVARTSPSDVGAFKPLQHEGCPPTDRGVPRTTTSFTFNGVLLPVTSVRQLGFLREDFFVGQEDREFSSRFRIAGLQMLAVPEAGVEHPNKGVARRGEVAVVRHYYSKRNSVYQRYGNRPLPIKLGGVALEVLTVVASLLIRRPYRHSLNRTAARLCGAWDGVFGRLGTRDYWFLSE